MYNKVLIDDILDILWFCGYLILVLLLYQTEPEAKLAYF